VVRQALRCPRKRFNIEVEVRAFAVLVLAPAFAFGAAAGAAAVAGGVVTPVTKPTSLVWNGRVFTGRADLAGWLRGRGVTYETWAKRHPTAALVLDHRASSSAVQKMDASSAQPSRLIAVLVAALAVLAVMALFLQRLGRSRKKHRAAGREPPSLRHATESALRTGISSLSAAREAASSPQGRRTLGRVALYAVSVVLTVGLGAAVALYLV
jgi:hypothetical protein